jgi:hypothetical protein
MYKKAIQSQKFRNIGNDGDAKVDMLLLQRSMQLQNVQNGLSSYLYRCKERFDSFIGSELATFERAKKQPSFTRSDFLFS